MLLNDIVEFASHPGNPKLYSPNPSQSIIACVWQNITDTIKHLPRVLRRSVMEEYYDTDDENAEVCCFPGCRLPMWGLDGTDNPWYWYNTDTTLQEAASMEVVHTF